MESLPIPAPLSSTAQSALDKSPAFALPLLYSVNTPNAPLAEPLLERLRHAIVTMRIRPGEMLSEQDIAKRFGISRQPVREAFIKLAEAGLVRILPQRGTLVVKISLEAVENARFIREAIECAVVRAAAQKHTKAHLDALAACLEDTALLMPVSGAGGSLKEEHGQAKTERLFVLDETFHRLLAHAAGYPHCWQVVIGQKAQMDRVRYLDMSDAIPMQMVLAQHQEIFHAVAAKDAARAENAMRTHLAEILRALPRLAERQPELFETLPALSHSAKPSKAGR